MTFYDLSEALFLPRWSLRHNRNDMSIDVFLYRQVHISRLRGQNDPRILRLSSESPDKVHRPRLLVQQAAQRLHAVAVNLNHFWRFKYASMARRICSATDSPVFSDKSLRAATTGLGRNICVRFMPTLYLYAQPVQAIACAPFLPGLNAGVSRSIR